MLVSNSCFYSRIQKFVLMKNHKLNGILMVCLGAVLFSSKAIFIKLAYAQFGVDHLTLLSLRFGYAFPFFLAIAFRQIRKNELQRVSLKDLGIIAVLALVGFYFASLLDFQGLQYISAGLERVILFVYPTFVVIFSRLFLKKSISKKALSALFITYSGIVLIAAEPRMFQSLGFIKGGTLILISAITHSLYLVFGGEMIRKYGSINFTTLGMLFSSVFVLIHYNFLSELALSKLPTGIHLNGLALAILCTVIPTFLMMEGIALLGASLGSIISGIEPVSTVFLAWIFLGETLSLQEFFGSLVVIFGVIMISK